MESATSRCRIGIGYRLSAIDSWLFRGPRLGQDIGSTASNPEGIASSSPEVETRGEGGRRFYLGKKSPKTNYFFNGALVIVTLAQVLAARL